MMTMTTTKTMTMTMTTELNNRAGGEHGAGWWQENGNDNGEETGMTMAR